MARTTTLNIRLPNAMGLMLVPDARYMTLATNIDMSDAT
jgi:hypothetical protein